MNYYIVDDDVSIIKMIEEIVLDCELGKVIGMSSCSVVALEEATLLKPDIVLVDLLMPEMDGITFVERLLKRSPATKCIMVSQVSSKKIVGEAYEKGITFFISKPVNKKEVRQVLKNVSEQVMLENSLAQIKRVLMYDDNKFNLHENNPDQDLEKKFKMIFSKLGILGESGCEEIIKASLYMKHNPNRVNHSKMMELSKEVSENPKAMEQRMRRSINKALSNIASLGIEDYLNETFVKYSNTLFDFEQVRLEMEYLRGKKPYGGKINIRKFVDNLLLIVEEM